MCVVVRSVGVAIGVRVGVIAAGHIEHRETAAHLFGELVERALLELVPREGSGISVVISVRLIGPIILAFRRVHSQQVLTHGHLGACAQHRDQVRGHLPARAVRILQVEVIHASVVRVVGAGGTKRSAGSAFCRRGRGLQQLAHSAIVLQQQVGLLLDETYKKKETRRK